MNSLTRMKLTLVTNIKTVAIMTYAPWSWSLTRWLISAGGIEFEAIACLQRKRGAKYLFTR